MPPSKRTRAAVSVEISTTRLRTKRVKDASEDIENASAAPVAKRPRHAEFKALPTKKHTTLSVDKKKKARATSTKVLIIPANESPRRRGPSKTKALSPPPLNSIPTPSTHTRPSLQFFVFGNGDFGQFGLGTGVLGDFARPRLQTWVDEAIKEGKLGGPGAGVEAVAAGGMHNLMIDESGKASSFASASYSSC